ncbi:GGDEF domain-containing protein [Cryptosporangium sp. NPDC051539]|uniref:GGDEF domain-containing protein n=1 Tax=Cryptosporangium sp. NPDC051539 TaxID=3363962 RepID=UPI00379F31D4
MRTDIPSALNSADGRWIATKGIAAYLVVLNLNGTIFGLIVFGAPDRWTSTQAGTFGVGVGQLVLGGLLYAAAGRLPQVVWSCLPLFMICATTFQSLLVDMRHQLGLLLLVPILYSAYYLNNRMLAATLAVAIAGNAVSMARPPLGVYASAEIVFFTIVAALVSLTVKRLRREVERLVILLARDASTDPLTGALNRRSFDEVFRAALADSVQTGRPVALVVFDVDHFKTINDTHGHAAGDRILCDVTEILRQCCRSTDYVGRLGGDEFALLMPGADSEEGAAIAERLRSGLAHGSGGGATLSVGVASAPAGGVTVAELTAAADQALYSAKRMGRNRIATFEGI